MDPLRYDMQGNPTYAEDVRRWIDSVGTLPEGSRLDLPDQAQLEMRYGDDPVLWPVIEYLMKAMATHLTLMHLQRQELDKVIKEDRQLRESMGQIKRERDDLRRNRPDDPSFRVAMEAYQQIERIVTEAQRDGYAARQRRYEDHRSFATDFFDREVLKPAQSFSFKVPHASPPAIDSTVQYDGRPIGRVVSATINSFGDSEVEVKLDPSSPSAQEVLAQIKQGTVQFAAKPLSPKAVKKSHR